MGKQSFFFASADGGHRSAQGFTLAELLIALAILGVIATFTIPKVLVAQQNSQYTAVAKEAVAMVSGAYQSYLMDNVTTASTHLGDFTEFMNYVSVDTVSTIDRVPGQTSLNCAVATPCLRLHNGAKLLYEPSDAFGGTSATSAIYFYFDPDGEYSGSATGQGKSIVFFLYASGRITTWGSVDPGTAGFYNPTPANDPSWFSWN